MGFPPSASALLLGDNDLILRPDSLPAVSNMGSFFLRGIEPRNDTPPLLSPPPSINSASRPANECICVSPDVDSLRDRSASDHAVRADAADVADVADVTDASDAPEFSFASCRGEVGVDRIDRNSGKHGVIGVSPLDDDEDDPDTLFVAEANFLLPPFPYFSPFFLFLDLDLDLDLDLATSCSIARFRNDAVVIDALLPIRGESFPGGRGGRMLDECVRTNGSDDDDEDDDDEDEDGEREIDPDPDPCFPPEPEVVPESWLVWMATGRICDPEPARPPFFNTRSWSSLSLSPSSSE